MAPRLVRLITALVLATMALMVLDRHALRSGSLTARLVSPVGRRSQPQLAGGSADDAGRAATAALLRECPLGCSGVGTCDEVSGTCACPLTRAGAACEEHTMRACEASDDGETLNLSVMATEPFWHGVPNAAAAGAAPVRWLGPLPCACVLQALGALAGAHASGEGRFARWWGSAPEMLYSVHVPCVRAPPGASVGSLARGAGAPADWASVLVWSWDYKLANNPRLLLPPLKPAEPPAGLEARVSTTWAAELWQSAIGREPAATAATDALLRGATVGLPGGWQPPLELRPSAACAHGCHGGGWCVADSPAAAAAAAAARRPGGARCECFDQLGADIDRASPGGLERAVPDAHCAPPAGAAADAPPSAAVGRFGPDRWRRWHWTAHMRFSQAELPDCPNGCRGLGRCEYGFCSCPAGRWGLDCGHTRAGALAELLGRARGDGGGGARPRIYVYNTPPALRRACTPWILPELVGDALLRSAHSSALASGADYYWLYGCALPGSLVIHALDWARRALPFWNASAAALAARGASGGGGGGGGATHLIVSPSEHGWPEAWQAAWMGRSTHAAGSPSWLRPGSDWWRQIAPDSAERVLGSLQLEGAADTRFKRELPPCHICFQRGKDVMVPAFRGVNDYPTERECGRLRRGLSPWAADAPAEADFEARRAATDLFFAGAVHTRKDVQPSRYEPWRLWRNASGFRLLQTERHPNVVDPREGWSQHVDLYAELRAAKACMVPMGKTGNYGQRMIPAMLAGCIPVVTKPAGSAQLLDEALNWPAFSLHVPHERAATLGPAIRGLDREARRAMQRELGCAWRRVLWTRVYGPCVGTERAADGEADAFDTLMDALRRRAQRLPPATSACEIRSIRT
jgi:hypothetical protein